MILWLSFVVIGGIISLGVYLLKWRPYRKIVSFRGRLLNNVNLARRERGLRSLGRTRLLDKVAAGHSRSMARRKHCDHHGFEKRLTLVKQKTGLSYVAENCYMFPASRYNSRVAQRLVEG